MSESYTFEWLCNELQSRTTLSRLEARGTVRLVLKDVGLDPASVSAHQMLVVVQRLLSAALSKRKVEDANALCQQLAEALAERERQRPEVHEDTAYDLFDRLESDTTRRRRE